MFNDEDIATAFIAKLAASELNTIDQFTTQSSSTGPANRLDPITFLKSNTYQSAQTNENAKIQQEIIEHLNKQAELAHPLPQPQTITYTDPPQHSAVTLFEDSNTSNETNITLEKILTVLTDISTTIKDIHISLNKA